MSLLTIPGQEHAVGLKSRCSWGERKVGFVLAGQAHGNLGSPAFTVPPGGFDGRMITGWVYVPVEAGCVSSGRECLAEAISRINILSRNWFPGLEDQTMWPELFF